MVLPSCAPAVYGRAGEEVLYFCAHRLEPLVIPGISSALGAPTIKFANIPVTHRRAAGSYTVCAGVRRGGKEITLQPSRLVQARAHLGDPPRPGRRRVVASDAGSRRQGAKHPGKTFVAIIERASMPD
ncbi:hypothetical protein D9611_005346 [Ephemerocybe angulata]|uniref:Uncharacterized protein n=1 Tax=Ephemerocybe angulata TaxID=980116 RepID=A0A8H5FD74_9AGAR|nr:hypothetical protein D9611_005346 [Tulosesus angulatus]